MKTKLLALAITTAVVLASTAGIAYFVDPDRPVFVRSFSHTDVPLIKADPRPYKRRPE